MKASIRILATTLTLALGLTGCGSSGPSDSDVLSAYKAYVDYRAQHGLAALPLPPQATVDSCKRDPSPPMDKGVFFLCYIRLDGKGDQNLNPVRLQREADGHWSMW